jgi:rhodanese-related sulfurtransferase
MASSNASVAPVAGREISREEIAGRIGDRRLAIVDVLPLESYEGGHLPGAISLPLAEVTGRARGVLPDLDREIVVYCGGFT